MEELRSTEILDKEIQEDARKKAERILKNADADCDVIKRDVQKRIDVTKKEKEEYYAKRLSVYKRDIDAAVPLEKERFLVSFVDRTIKTAIESYIISLSNEKRLLLIANLLAKYKNALTGKKAHIFINGFSKNDIEKLLKKECGEHFIESVVELDDIQAKDRSAYRGILIETTDKTVRCRATLDEVMDSVSDSYRYELAHALFGGRLPQ